MNFIHKKASIQSKVPDLPKPEWKINLIQLKLKLWHCLHEKFNEMKNLTHVEFDLIFTSVGIIKKLRQTEIKKFD